MPIDALLALIVIAATGAWTPGPNNALVASSGAVHGFRATLPHILGIALGFPVMIILVGLSLGGLFQQSALFRETLKLMGAAVLLWMAWRTATAGRAEGRAARRPFTFLESAGFQWINPKGWAFAIGVTAQFVTPDAPALTALICGAVFMFAGAGSSLTWVVAGQAFSRWLTTPGRLRAFNVAMGALIGLSVVFLFLDP